jgi:hypothetical protein
LHGAPIVSLETEVLKRLARMYYAKLVELAGKGEERPELQQANDYLAGK